MERLAEVLTAALNGLTARIRSAQVATGRYLDPDDAAINDIEEGCRALEASLPTLLMQKSTSVEDVWLHGGQSGLLDVALDRSVAALAGLIEASKDLRAAVISHDLAAEPRPSETYDSSEGLMASLRANSP